MLPQHAGGDPLADDTHRDRSGPVQPQESASTPATSARDSTVRDELRSIVASGATSFEHERGERRDFAWPGPDGVSRIAAIYCNGRGYGR